MDNTNVIIKPLVTEKSTHQQTTRNAYAFQVHAEREQAADQAGGREAVQREGRRRAHDEPQGQAAPHHVQDDARRSDWKRAIVVLDENSRIELF